VIIDTDLSFDDYVALLYLLQHPAVDVRAITIANGVVHIKQGVENARRLLSLVGRSDIPVAGGPEKPLAGQHSFPGSWRFLLDYGIRFLLPRKKATPVYHGSAVELIRQQVSTSEVPVTFIALAPLTNLALALRADPGLAERFDAIFINGGAIYVSGHIHDDNPSNPNVVSGWNLYVDPVAADIVFKSGARLALIPVDVTHVSGPQPLLFSREFVHRLGLAAKGRASRLLVRIIRLWQLATPRYPATPVWDGVTAAIAAEPTIGSDWRDLGIRIVTQPESAAGQTVVDDSQPVNAHVCLGGNQTAFETAYLAVCGRGIG
jgi:inosine-uridine nucleoside N-ribohydrolase